MAGTMVSSPTNALKLQGCSSQLMLAMRCSSSSRSSFRLRSVKCNMSKDGESKAPTPASKGEAPPPPATVPSSVPPPPPPSPPIQKDTGFNFSKWFAFSGPVPEAVNGRLAMLGFTTALAMELASGEDLFAQVENGGVNWFTATALVFTLASLVPLSQGITIDKTTGGIGGVFTAKAERWNGRAAMLGLVALALTEFVKGSPLI